MLQARGCEAYAGQAMSNAAAAWTGAFDPWLSLCLATKPPVTPATFWQSWSFAPEIVGPLLIAALAYVRFSRKVAEPQRAWRALAFAGGWLLLAAALISPLCRAAATLAAAHMVQHAILVALAPPLLVLGLAPVRRSPRGLPAASRHPVAVATLYAMAIWLAHAPAIYEAALRGAVAHLALVAVLLATSLAFWSAVLRPRHDSGSGAACITGILLCFTAMVQTGLLGALLSFARTPWYPILAARSPSWGIDPLADLQLAGLIMWVPMSAIYVAGCLILTARWLQSADAMTSGGHIATSGLGAVR